MDGCRRLGHGRGFLRVISGANLLINIIEGPRKFSDDFATGFSGCFRTRLPNGYPLWCLGKIIRRPKRLLRESVSGPRTIKTKLSTMTTFPAFRILHPTIQNIIRPQPGKLLDARAFEWMDAVVWGMGGAVFGLFRVQTYSLTS